MNLDVIIKELNLQVLTEKKDFSHIEPSHGYVSDMLSCVMTGAGQHSVWVTLQAQDAQPDEKTIAKANEEGVTLLTTKENSFNIAGKLWVLGLKDK